MRGTWDRTWAGVIVAVVMATASRAGTAAEPATPARLLVVTVTTGFRHASIATAEPALEELGRTSGLFHVDFLRMPPGRPAAPKPPKRGKGTTDEAWAEAQAAFKSAQEQFKTDDDDVRRRGVGTHRSGESQNDWQPHPSYEPHRN